MPAAVECEEYDIYVKRVKVALMYLGHAPKLVSGTQQLDHTSPRGDALDFKTSGEGTAETSAAGEHTRKLHEELKAANMPMEDHTAFQSFTQVQGVADEISKAETVESIEALSLEIERQSTFAALVLDSIKSTKKAYAKVVSDFKRAADKTAATEALDKAKAAALQAEQQGAADLLVLVSDGTEKIFDLKWDEAGHKTLAEYTVEQFSKLREGVKDFQVCFDMPLLLADEPHIKTILASETSTFKSNCVAFHTKFSASPGAKTNGFTGAPAQVKHGSSEVMAIWDEIFPKDYCLPT